MSKSFSRNVIAYHEGFPIYRAHGHYGWDGGNGFTSVRQVRDDIDLNRSETIQPFRRERLSRERHDVWAEMAW